MDLSDVFGRAARIADDDSRVKDKIAEIAGYAATAQVPGASLTRMAKLGVVLLEWMDQNGLDASAIQCWSSMQQNFGVNVCTVMSMMLSLIHISEPTRLGMISYAVFCLKKKKTQIQ